jgi:putative motility protein YjfB-like
MDMSLVFSIMSMQAAATQTQVATAVLKQNNDAEKSAVQTLLGTGPSPASLPAGVGGNLDISA